MRRLPSTAYLAFPLRIDALGAGVSQRREHVREQIAQVIGTASGERIFRPEFGAGLQRLVFEPNAPALWDLARKRLSASLSEALQGEVDPRTLDIEVSGLETAGGLAQQTLRVRITYQLAALGERDEQTFILGEAGLQHG